MGSNVDMKRILELDIKSSLKYQIIFTLSACMHVTFLIIFVISGIYTLAVFNVLSIVFYAAAALRSRKSSFEEHIIGWLTVTYMEITAHAVICTIWMGFETCFFMYSMIVLTVASYVLYLACDHEKFLGIIIPFALITVVTLAAVFLYLLFFPPLFAGVFGRELSEGQIQLMKGVNIFFNTFIIFFFTLTFIAEMNLLVRKLNESNERLNFIADHDALTGLYNRRSLYRLFDKIHGRDGEEGDNKADSPLLPNKDRTSDSFCVIMGDIDDFKKINDTYGHHFGDEILKAVSGVLKSRVNGNDIACRWGGEEFLIIMSGSREDCLKRAEEIRCRVGGLRTLSGDTEVFVTMTFGLADSFERTDGSRTLTAASIDELVQIADERLYRGKRNGKNAVVS